MLTRSKARASGLANAIVLVSPSATGKGTHTRWCYPEGYTSSACASTPLSPPPPSHTEDEGNNTDSDDSSSGQSSHPFPSFSSLSTLSSVSSFEDLSTTLSSDKQELDPPTTPQNQLVTQTTPQTPIARRFLHIPPPNLSAHTFQSWNHMSDSSTRHIYAPDTFSEEDIQMRRSILESQLSEVAERELDLLLRRRTNRLQESESDCSEDDSTTSGVVRWAATELSERAVIASPSRRLGPHGTELIGSTFLVQ